MVVARAVVVVSAVVVVGGTEEIVFDVVEACDVVVVFEMVEATPAVSSVAAQAPATTSDRTTAKTERNLTSAISRPVSHHPSLAATHIRQYVRLGQASICAALGG